MECHVCYNPYNSSSRKPKNLPCGHTYCAECLTKLLNQSTSIITCPEDRTECKVPNKNIEQLMTNFALMNLLPADCLECNKKPQDGPCLPEHCSKRLCSDCKTTHLEKFSTELVDELQAIKKEVTEQQAMCDDDSALTRMVDQSKAAITEVTRVFDAEKEKLIDVIKKKQEIGSRNYFQWKNNFNHCLARSRGIVDKVLSEIKQTGDSQSGKFLSDVKKQLTQEKEAISRVEDTKEHLPLFDASEVQKIFDEMMPAMYFSVMPFLPDYTAAEFCQSFGKRGTGAGEFKQPWEVATSPITESSVLPDTWSPMNDGDRCSLIQLKTTDPEYQQVQQDFSKTYIANNIVKIERVQNPTLYKQYQVKKESMEKANTSGQVIERTLYHSTSEDSVKMINATGFNRSYCGKNATVLGNGLYFARDASYSPAPTYSPPSPQGYKHVYHSKVLTGEYTTGQSGLKAPPPKSAADPSILFDSVADNTGASPSIFVIFYDTQAYPEYLITFT